MVLYPEYAEELIKLLKRDQEEWRSFWRDNYQKQQSAEFNLEFKKVRQLQNARTKRMLAILDDIQEPSLSKIGADAAQAISILALHDNLSVLKRVLVAFDQCYKRNKSDTYYQAIPSMTDRVLILERKPQVYGTQWHTDGLNIPFLPTVEDFDNVNERRAQYGIEPLRWPKSLAIPEGEQPWLAWPISKLTMRSLTDKEFTEANGEYLL